MCAVQGASPIKILPKLTLNNCLFVPDLSHKLLSVSQLTKELNYTVMIGPHFCIVQDQRTGEIIGRGIEKNGLYYVEKISQKGCAALLRESVEQQLWKWHRRLRHPSLGYLEHLFPYLRGSNIDLIVSHVFWLRAINIHTILV